jgi:hypothetical protein
MVEARLVEPEPTSEERTSHGQHRPGKNRDRQRVGPFLGSDEVVGRLLQPSQKITSLDIDLPSRGRKLRPQPAAFGHLSTVRPLIPPALVALGQVRKGVRS